MTVKEVVPENLYIRFVPVRIDKQGVWVGGCACAQVPTDKCVENLP